MKDEKCRLNNHGESAQEPEPRIFNGFIELPGHIAGLQGINPVLKMPKFNIKHVLFPAACLLFLAFPSLLSGGESIARIQQLEQKLAGKDNRYLLELQTLAWLSNITVDNFKISELSGLAWDRDEQLLFALSDNGYLLHLRAQFEDRKLVNLTMEKITPLLDERGRPLKYKPSDSEGLAIMNDRNSIKGDTQLLVSFERIPRIVRYDINGKWLGEVNMPAILTDIRHYHSENKSLESVVIHPEFGVITGTELPLQQDDNGQMNLYAMTGEHWSFPPQNPYYGALVDLTIMEDGSMLALERSYGGLFPVMEITLHRLVPGNGSLKHEIIYTFDSRDGVLDENFEGITHHEGNYYFMISDDNNNPFNRTLLVYFSITPCTSPDSR